MDADTAARRASDAVSDRLGDILQGLGAEIVKSDLHLALDVIIGGAGDQDTARFGQGFKAGGNINAVAVKVAALDHDIQVDANTQHDVAIAL
jgi:hypothetical protein